MEHKGLTISIVCGELAVTLSRFNLVEPLHPTAPRYSTHNLEFLERALSWYWLKHAKSNLRF